MLTTNLVRAGEFDVGMFRTRWDRAAARLAATRERDADLAYAGAEEFLSDLRVVQDSLRQAGALRMGVARALNEIDAESNRPSLKKAGFSFVGPTICYAFMQATGMVMDHTRNCFRYAELGGDPAAARPQ